MLTEALAALAASGGAAVAGAMATDAWQMARQGIADLFGRAAGGERRATIQSQLDGNVVLVERSSEPEEARQGLAALWRMELARLLEEHPEVEPELRDLVTQIRHLLPVDLQTWVQTNVARENARLFAVQGGNLVYHESSARDRDAPAQTRLRRIGDDEPGRSS